MPTTEEELRQLGQGLLSALGEVLPAHVEAKSQVVGYDLVGEAQSLEASRVVGQAVAQLIAENRPYEALAPLIRAIAIERAEAGVPLDAVLRVLQKGQVVLYDAIDVARRRLDLAAEVAIEANARIARSLEAAMDDVADVYRERDEREDVAQRQAVLRAVFAGRDPTGIIDEAATLGLTSDSDYFPALARAHDDAQAEVIHEALLVVARDGGGIVAWLDDHIAALLAAAPSAAPPDATVVVGPAAPFARLAGPCQQAVRLFEAATIARLTGVLDLAAIGTRLPIVLEHELGDHLFQRFVEPLTAHGAAGAELKKTLVAYFEEGLHPQATATRLIVHRNTLTKRLRRYERLTGANLSDPNDLFGVWWALQRDQLLGGAASALVNMTR